MSVAEQGLTRHSTVCVQLIILTFCLQWNCEVITRRGKWFRFQICSNSETSDVWEEDSSSRKVPKINNPCRFKWHKNILACLFTDELLTCSASGWSSSHASRCTKIHKMLIRLLQILCIPKILTLIYTSFQKFFIFFPFSLVRSQRSDNNREFMCESHREEHDNSTKLFIEYLITFLDDRKSCCIIKQNFEGENEKSYERSFRLLVC